MWISEMVQKFRTSHFFLDKCIWIGCRKISLLRGEFLSSTVNEKSEWWKKYDKGTIMQI